jgi:hypothetical protein
MGIDPLPQALSILHNYVLSLHGTLDLN